MIVLFGVLNSSAEFLYPFNRLTALSGVLRSALVPMDRGEDCVHTWYEAFGLVNTGR